MATQTLNKSKEEVEALIKEADAVLDELTNTHLAPVEVKISKNSPSVIKAIRMVFGDAYIKADGSSIITYKMYQKVNELLRTAGNLKMKEYM